METSAEDDEIKEAKAFTNFYIDMFENHLNTFSFYLSESATLDWFGKTIKGEKDIGAFLKNNAATIKHLMCDPKPVNEVGHRDTHVINYPTKQKKRSLTLKKSPILANSKEKTPPNEHAGSSNVLEQGQGDGLHNCEIVSSPPKRCRISDVIICSEPTFDPVKYVSMEGHIEFRRKSSKKYQKETKWKRPCKLEIAYSTTNITDSTIHLIIYSCDMKCKRNLLNDFDRAD